MLKNTLVLSALTLMMAAAPALACPGDNGGDNGGGTCPGGESMYLTCPGGDNGGDNGGTCPGGDNGGGSCPGGDH